MAPQIVLTYKDYETLRSDGYALADRVRGDRPVGLPPFPDLGLILDALWS